MRQRPEDPIGGRPEDGVPAARLPRQAMTPAERVLWEAVRGRRLAGLKFRQQYQLDPFVTDSA